jgi:hypothetical protein
MVRVAGKRWSIGKVSRATAFRELDQLVDMGLLKRNGITKVLRQGEVFAVDSSLLMDYSQEYRNLDK